MSKPILLIDDEEKFAKMLHELLQLNGFESEYCLNPREALALLHRENFDLVITDYKMPEMDGAQFLEGARKVNPDLPVIMISGLMNMPELIKVANIGVTLVLEKPFKTEELLEHVSRFVRPAEDTGSSASAMDMEASELHLQQEPVEVTYPTPTQTVSDHSNENKRFLETLWRNANTCRHLPFYAPKGAEVRLVAEEVLGWTGEESGEEVVRIDLINTKTDFTRGWIMERDTFPRLLLVDMRDASWDAGRVAMLSGWIRFIEESGKDLSLSRILYALPTGADFKVDELGLDASVTSLFSIEFPVLLSLRERILDTATYIARFLDPEEKSALGHLGLKLLLHYSWPGGYQELQTVLGEIRNRVGEGGFRAEMLGDIISGRSADPSPLPDNPSLEGYLKRRQREYVLLHREGDEPLKDTLLRLGIETGAFDPEAILRDEILIYPDLVDRNNR